MSLKDVFVRGLSEGIDLYFAPVRVIVRAIREMCSPRSFRNQ